MFKTSFDYLTVILVCGQFFAKQMYYAEIKKREKKEKELRYLGNPLTDFVWLSICILIKISSHQNTLSVTFIQGKFHMIN